jgi:endonuclease/exonuclease/phosphatase family metal-dependent hydrolase
MPRSGNNSKPQRLRPQWNKQRGAAACKFVYVERFSADWLVLHNQFHRQTPQFELPILWEWPTCGPTDGIACKVCGGLQDARGEVVTIATWNLEWFPGGKPNSSRPERLVHMSAAKDALLDIRPDILCLQEVRDWNSVAELVSILPGFQTLVVSRFREMGSSGPLSIQQTAIASKWQAEAAWSESFKPSPVTPPRGFSFAVIPRGKTMLPIYSVHFKSNRGEATSDIAKREEAAHQLLAPAAKMERAYSQTAKVVTIIAGDFNTDPMDARFESEGTFGFLREKFAWSWENVPLSERVTNSAKGRYPTLMPASTDFYFAELGNFPVSQSPSKVSVTIFRLFLRLQSTK